MKRDRRTVFVILVVVALVLASYWYFAIERKHETASPDISITAVNFNLNYSGTFKNYVIPTVGGQNGTPGVSNAFVMNHMCFFTLWLMLSANLSSQWYSSLNSYGYSANDSVILKNMSVSTQGISMPFRYNGEIDSGIVFNPSENAPWPVTFETSDSHYSGQLNLSLSFVSPVTNLVFYTPHAEINYQNGSLPVVYLEGSSITSEQIGEYHESFYNQTVTYSVLLESSNVNFSLTNVSVSSPFLIENSSLNLPIGASESFLGPHELYLDISILMPDQPYPGSLNLVLTVDTNS